MSLLILREREPHFGFNNFDFDTDELLWPLKIASFYNNHHRRLTEAKKHLSKKRKYKDVFEVNVSVQQFKPEELTVKVVENNVIIEGNHEERQDEHGYVSRSFKRRYLIPEGYDLDKIESTLSSDGILTLTAPKVKSIENNKEKIIPIIQTGPVRQLKAKETEEEEENKKKRKKEE